MATDLRLYCQVIIGAMLTTRQTEVFGPTSDPAAEVMTPALVGSGEELRPVYSESGLH